MSRLMAPKSPREMLEALARNLPNRIVLPIVLWLLYFQNASLLRHTELFGEPSERPHQLPSARHRGDHGLGFLVS